MEKKLSKELVGTVVSSANDKTITVLVETRPLSKTKHFYLKEIVKEAVII